MLRKKFYIPIGLCVLAIVAIGFLSLRSDVPDEPIVIYKSSIVEKSTAEAPVGDTSQGGHSHGDEWHAEPHEKHETPAVSARQSYIPEGAAVSPNFPPVNPNEEPVEAAYKRLEYIKNNPYAWGGVHSERATELIAELMPPPVLVEHADGDEVYALIVELIAENDPRTAGVLITNICDGNISGWAMYDALVEIGPLSVPYILPYLEKGVAEGGHIRSGVFNTLSRIAAEYPSELGGIVEHIIIPKIAKIAADKDFKRYDSGTVIDAQGALARLGR